MSGERRMERGVAAGKPANSLISERDRSPAAGPERVAMVMLPLGARGAIPPEACDGQSAIQMVSGGLTMMVAIGQRSEEHTSELQSLLRISYAVFCLKKTKKHKTIHYQTYTFVIKTHIVNNNN